MTILAEDVDLRDEVMRWPHGILANANALPGGWEKGVTFRTGGCTTPELVATCVATDITEARPGLEVFDPIIVEQTAACSTISQVGTVNMARNRLEGTTEWALGQLVQNGAGGTNVALTDADYIHEISDVAGNLPLQMVDLLSCLEQSVANTGFGGGAVLHAPPRAAAYLRAGNLVDDNGYSPNGLKFIFSPGYTPDDIDADTQTLWVSATGPLWAEAGPVELMMDTANGRPAGTSWRQNLDSTYAARTALAAFDTCINLRATMVVPACIGGS